MHAQHPQAIQCLWTQSFLFFQEVIKPVHSLQECRFSMELDLRLAQVSLQRKPVFHAAVQANRVRDAHLYQEFFRFMAFGWWEKLVPFCFQSAYVLEFAASPSLARTYHLQQSSTVRPQQ